MAYYSPSAFAVNVPDFGMARQEGMAIGRTNRLRDLARGYDFGKPGSTDQFRAEAYKIDPFQASEFEPVLESFDNRAAKKAQSEAAKQFMAMLSPQSAPTSAPAQTAAVPSEYRKRLRQIESGGNDTAQAPTSSATGRYQPIKATWAQYAPQGADPNDPAAQEQFLTSFLADNAKNFQGWTGRAPTDAEQYAMHWFGPQNAKRLYQSKPDTPIENIIGPQAAQANGIAGQSVGNVRTLLEQRMGTGTTWNAAGAPEAAPAGQPQAFDAQAVVASMDPVTRQYLANLFEADPIKAQGKLVEYLDKAREKAEKVTEPEKASIINMQFPDGTIKAYDATDKAGLKDALGKNAVEIGTGQAMSVDINGDGVPEIVMGGKQGGGKLTEVQSKDIGFHDMAALGNAMINDTMTAGFDPSGWGSYAKWQTGAAGESQMTPAEQQYFAGVRAFINSILRKDSGAAITEDEWANNYPLYFPMPGNGPEVIALKAQLRRTRIDSLKKGLGSASSLVSDEEPKLDKPKDTKPKPGDPVPGMDGWVFK